MRQLVLICIGLTLALAVCGCKGEKPSAGSRLQATSPAVTETEVPSATVVETPPKVKAAMQAFFDAALEGKIDFIESELAAGVPINATNENTQTVLMLAAYNGHTALVDMLIDRGGDVNHPDSINRTALMYAASGPFTETVRLLIQKDAEVNIIDNNEGWTALMFAAAEGQVENVRLLLESGADRTLKDIDGDTAADFATQKNHPNVAKMIRDYTQTHP